ncbi:MAG: hypothetical protein HOG49_41975 [Candidatus Scalindua sp.]|jgi:hypothetical protein|nr:hypothetical protein [Candidatus Scalindua sp.]
MTMKLVSRTSNLNPATKRIIDTVRGEVVYCEEFCTYMLNTGGGTMLELCSNSSTGFCYAQDQAHVMVRELYDGEKVTVEFS